MKKSISFDFNNMFSSSIGTKHGITKEDLKRWTPVAEKAQEKIKDTIKNRENRIKIGLEWIELGCHDPSVVEKIMKTADYICKNFKNVISLGIGGSYLGLKAAQDALASPYYNEFDSLRKGRPKIYFEGNNLDPTTIGSLLKNLDPRETCITVISKSGETTETKVAFDIARNWLKNHVGGENYGKQIIAITDPSSGSLRKLVNSMQEKDRESFIDFSVFPGVGGRYSEFNIGLLHLALIGVNLEDIFAGIRDMKDICFRPDVLKNPALLYATLQSVLYLEKGKSISIMMPFSEGLKSTAEWYVQLLAESLGKEYKRKIIKDNGLEVWTDDMEVKVNRGRTPVPCRGTNDLHSIQQNNIGGENNKTLTLVEVQDFGTDMEVPVLSGELLAGRKLSALMSLAVRATEWALMRAEKPNMTIIMPEVSPYTWAQLLYFFEIATTYEGEFLDVYAFHQPGVEGYKNYMYKCLGKEGLKKEIIEEIDSNPLKKLDEYIIQ